VSDITERLCEDYADRCGKGPGYEAMLEIERLRTRVAELEAERAWRPIETAPKDGGCILACDARTVDWYLVVGWSQTSDIGWGWSTQDGLTYHQDSLTHWMPLPAAPKSEGGE